MQDLDFNFDLTPSMCASLQSAMSNHRCMLESLTVASGTDYNDDFLLAISRSVEANPNVRLKYLTVRNINASVCSIAPLFDSLIKHRIGLLTLNLSVNYFCQVCLDKLAEYIASSVCVLESLVLDLPRYYFAKLDPSQV